MNYEYPDLQKNKTKSEKPSKFNIEDTPLDLNLDDMTNELLAQYLINDQLFKRNNKSLKAEIINPTESLRQMFNVGSSTIQQSELKNINVEKSGNNQVDLVRIANANFQRDANILDAVYSGDQPDTRYKSAEEAEFAYRQTLNR